MNIWLLAVYLQVLDFITTIIFMKLGVQEANPLVNRIMYLWGVWGLIVMKLMALAILLVLWRKKMPKIVIWSNYLYMAVVIWNLLCIFKATSLGIFVQNLR